MNVLWIMLAIPCLLIVGFFVSSMLFSGGRSTYGDSSKQEKTADAKVLEIRETFDRQMKISSAIGRKLSSTNYQTVIRHYVTFELENEEPSKVDLLVDEDAVRNLKIKAEVRITWKKDKCISCVVREKPLEETEWYIQ